MATTAGKPIDAAYLLTQLKNFESKIIEEKYQTIMQVSTLPTAAATNVGKIYQYIGASDASYTNGYFYKCISETDIEASTTTYKWVAVTTQAEAQEYTIKKAETADTGMSATYQLYKGETAIGDKINVPKDWLLKNVTLNTCTEADKPETGFVVGDKYFDFEFNVKEAAQETSTHVYLKVNDLVDIYTGGNAINVSNTNVISVMTATTNSGLKLVNEGTEEAPVNKLSVDFETVNIDFENDWE